MSVSNAGLITKLWLGVLFALMCVLVIVTFIIGPGSVADPDPTNVPPSAKETEPRLVVAQVDALPDSTDPFDARWDKVPVFEVPVQPQMMTMPMLEQATIDHVQLQVMSNGQTMAWRLSWSAPEPAHEVDTGRFSDAVAVQFPLADGAPPIMGSADRPVHMLYWKAQWQRDVDEGFQDVQDLHPNFWSDVYWFVQGEFPYPVAESFEDEHARQHLAAHAAGNPMAQLHRAQPVQELFAEGFGTLTHYPEPHAAARGTWRDGQWVVVLERRLDVDDELARRLASGQANQMSVAVWDGAAGNVGGRKHWTMWVPIEVRR